MANDAYVTSPQLYARLGGVLYLVTIVFGAFSEGFAMNTLIEGYLLYKSGYFPKFNGILMQVAGVSYLIYCFTELLAPSIAGQSDLLPVVVVQRRRYRQVE